MALFITSLFTVAVLAIGMHFAYTQGYAQGQRDSNRYRR